jgi:uncharacterized protein YcbK (DUF882 family)
MGDLTKNFSKAEFDCNDGSKMPEKVLANVKKQAKNLQVLRDFLDKPIRINSGYRSPSYNKKIGGAKNSQHLKGNATDIKVKGMSPGDLGRVIEGLIRIGAIEDGGLGLYSNFTHYDRRSKKARWNG